MNEETKFLGSHHWFNHANPDKRNVEYVKCRCFTCGNEFEMLPSQVRSGKGKYCSQECSRNRPGGDPRNKRLTGKCEVCGKGFEYKAYRQGTAKYCSMACYRIGRRGKPRVCAQCGEAYDGSKASRDGSPPGRKYCSRRCRDDARNKKVVMTCEVCGKEFMVKAYRKEEAKCCSTVCSYERKALLMALGKIRSYTNARQGTYVSLLTGREERYDSSWELLRMKQLDDAGEEWTKAHGITIPYEVNGGVHRYIPDFLVKGKEGERIEEVKPRFMLDDPKVRSKGVACMAFCEGRGIGYRLLTEVDLGLVDPRTT